MKHRGTKLTTGHNYKDRKGLQKKTNGNTKRLRTDKEHQHVTDITKEADQKFKLLDQ